jgi:hypothetical protein
VQQCHAAPGYREVNGNTVRHRDGEQDPGCGGDPPIYSVQVDPALAGIELPKLSPVDLIPECDRLKGTQCAPKREPSTHHLAHRGIAPQAEIEAAARLATSAGDAGDDSMRLAPIDDLVSGYRPGYRDFGDFRE